MYWKEFIITGMKLIKFGCDMADDCADCPIYRPDHISCTDFLDYIENFMEKKELNKEQRRNS